jgi:hypothetical protein
VSLHNSSRLRLGLLARLAAEQQRLALLALPCRLVSPCPYASPLIGNVALHHQLLPHGSSDGGASAAASRRQMQQVAALICLRFEWKDGIADADGLQGMQMLLLNRKSQAHKTAASGFGRRRPSTHVACHVVPKTDGACLRGILSAQQGLEEVRGEPQLDCKSALFQRHLEAHALQARGRGHAGLKAVSRGWHDASWA